MDALILVLAAGACLLVAYVTYGRWLSRRVFGLRDDALTPATELEDGTDYVPTKKSIVFGHHFTSIAGTGPIVGPAIAVMWGWLPAILWVVLGSIFVGAVHDLGSLVVSLRNKGRSIGDIAGDLLGPRARLIFLFILIMGLWIVLAIFGLVVAAVLRQYPSAITPVLIQVPIALVIGVVIHRKGRSIVLPSVIALALMYASVIYGDVGFLHDVNTALAALPTWAWVASLLIYAYIASVLPVWTLLQPRDYINALQLITSLGVLVVGLAVAGLFGGAPDDTSVIEFAAPSPPEVGEGGSPAFRGEPGEGVSSRPELSIVAPMIDWQPIGAPPMLPVLFITIACGACSGFHCLVGSGTTSKQMRKETDAKAVGYGSMLTEGFLATLVIASCVAGLGLGSQKEVFYSLSSWNDAGDRTQMGLLGTPDPYGEAGVEKIIFTPGRKDTIDPASPPNNPTVLSEPIPASLGIFYFDGKLGAHGVEAYDPPNFFVQNLTTNEFIKEDVFAFGDQMDKWLRLPEGDVKLSADTEALELRGSIAFDMSYASWQEAGSLGAKVGAFVQGAANLIASIGIPHKVGLALMAVLVASFAGTTMDTACRLQRYVVQELSRTFLPKRRETDCTNCGYDMRAHTRGTGDSHTCPECGTPFDPALATPGVKPEEASFFNPFRWLVTIHGATLFAVFSAFALAVVPTPGSPWTLANAGSGGLILWPLFGATNQLLGGFAFIVITSWLLATKKPVLFIVIPLVFMLLVPASAMTWQAFIGNALNPSWLSQSNWLLVVIASATLALEAWLVIETLAHWALKRPFDALNQ